MHNIRKIAIIYTNDIYKENVSNSVRLLAKCAGITDISVYTRTARPEFNIPSDGSPCVNVIIPEGLDTEPKIRNWINYIHRDFGGFLHVLSDSVEIVKDPTAFVLELETAMSVLDYPFWMSTCTDGCNFVYSKYNPRLTITCNMPECEKLGLPKQINFTSNSNTQWVAYDMPAVRDTGLDVFNEQFSIPMFFIIEALARRRNTKADDQLYFMNQYMTVGSEYGTIRNVSNMQCEKHDAERMKKEDELFKSLNIDYQPDNNIDITLEKLWCKILSKADALGA